MVAILAFFKFIFLDIIGDFIYWPVWWYTVGLKDRFVLAWQQIREMWCSLAVGLWLRHIFTPMYADYTLLGRLISFPIRLLVLAWKFFWFILWFVLIMSIIALWIFGPLFIIYMIGSHFNTEITIN